MDEFLIEIMPAIMQFASVIVLALIGWATNSLKKWLDEKGVTEQITKYDYLAEIVVEAVDQIYQNEDGDVKLQRAKHIFLDSLPDKAKVSDMQLDAFLESAVKRMNEEWVVQ